MTYASQRIASRYFLAAVIFFGLQVVFGLFTGAKYVWDHDPLLQILPFNTSRAIHLNLLVVWLLLGFMGGAYYLVPEEAEAEIHSPRLAVLQFWLFLALAVTAVIGYLSGWSWGMPFLEQPPVIKAGIVVVALMFLYNIFMTVRKGGRWTGIQGTLLAGLVMLAGLFLAGIFFLDNLATQYYWWWWVIHLWVEGAWELVAASMMAFILLKTTGVDRSLVEKWLYLEAGLVLFTGIAGTGHHYYWIGTPAYWLWVGGVFSALEPVPIVLMVIDALRDVREKKLPVNDTLPLTWAVGGVLMHFFGAGVWGFGHTLPQINRWTHGTQITASHGHFAFFGAYVTLNITMIYFALPRLRGLRSADRWLGRMAFWMMTTFMVVMVLAFAVAGIVQSYFQRVLGMDYFTAQGFMKPWYIAVWGAAWLFALGAGAFIADVFTLGRGGKPETVRA